MVRQYKIHTNLDGTDDKVWDVTNGKVRLYQPSNLGLQSTNNIWQSNIPKRSPFLSTINFTRFI